MKYIKEYNHEFYYEISEKEYFDTPIDIYHILQKEYNIIIDYTKQINPRVEFNFFSPGEKNKETVYSSIELTVQKFGTLKKATLTIQATKDEWFLCTIGYFPFHDLFEDKEKHYKCDQMEGLLKLIKDTFQNLYL